MTRLLCRGCAATLTQELRPAESDLLDPAAEEGTPSLPRGVLVAEPSVTPGVGPVGGRRPEVCLVVHPDDVCGLRSAGGDHGCCGSDGLDGLNRACARCGRMVATARTDCWTPHEVRFRVDAVRAGGPVRVPDGGRVAEPR